MSKLHLGVNMNIPTKLSQKQMEKQQELFNTKTGFIDKTNIDLILPRNYNSRTGTFLHKDHFKWEPENE